MATITITPGERAANPTLPLRSISKTTSRAVDMARLHLRTGNPSAYAPALAGEHRATNKRQQKAIGAVMAFDGLERLFLRHQPNCCLLAKEN